MKLDIMSDYMEELKAHKENEKKYLRKKYFFFTISNLAFIFALCFLASASEVFLKVYLALCLFVLYFVAEFYALQDLLILHKFVKQNNLGPYSESDEEEVSG